MDDADRRFFMNCVREAFDQYKVRLLSDCLMPNHFHLVAAPAEVPLGLPMHLVQTRYAHRFNQRYDRVGHLFQNRFHSVPVLDVRQLVSVSVYVNENALRARLVRRVEEWSWSSHAELMGGDRGLLDLDALPEVAGLEREEFLELYRDRIAQGPERYARLTLPEMLDEAAALSGLTRADLVSGAPGWAQSRGRRLVARWATQAGLTPAEIAAALGISPQAVWKLKT